MMQTDIPRWILASASTHFAALFAANNVPMMIEGQKRDTRTHSIFGEFRMDGPDIKKGCGSTSYDFMINIMVQSAMNNSDLHRSMRLLGLISAGFWDLLPILTYGETVVKTIGCARLTDDNKNRDIRIYQLGQIGPDTDIQRSAVAGRYILTL
jgi:hypothetical protein